MLYFREYGDASAKETILFLHGGGLSGEMWEGVAHKLHGRHCIAVDLPEHGESTAEAGLLTTDNCIRQVGMILQKYEAVHVVGLSLGGAVALHLLASHADKIKSAVITGTAAGISKTTAKLMNVLAAPLYSLMSPEKIAASMIKNYRIPEQHKPSLLRDAKRINSGVVRRMHTMLSEIKLPLASSIPLLVLVGEEENRLAKQAASKLLAQVPESTGGVVPGGTHVWSYGKPELFAEVIELWMSENRRHAELK